VAEQERAEQDHDLGHRGREHKKNGLLDVPVDHPAFLDDHEDRREVVVGEDDLRRLLGHLGPREAHREAHRDADVRPRESGRVVRAIARHRHDVTAGLEGAHDPQLLRGLHAREDRDAVVLRRKRVIPGRKRARVRPIASSVTLWSPVSITGRAPAIQQACTASRTSKRCGSIWPTSFRSLARPRRASKPATTPSSAASTRADASARSASRAKVSTLARARRLERQLANAGMRRAGRVCVQACLRGQRDQRSLGGVARGA